jgi:hypothetical protein
MFVVCNHSRLFHLFQKQTIQRVYSLKLISPNIAECHVASSIQPTVYVHSHQMLIFKDHVHFQVPWFPIETKKM